MRTSWELLAGSSAIDAPRRRKRLRVASSSSISATTMSPVSAPSIFLITAMSPSRMPASIIESPRTSRAKCSPADSRSGGILMTLLLFWIASIGVPAAMRPITGTAIGRVLSSSADGARTRPRLPSMTLGTKPRERPLTTPWLTDSGSLITSMARARFGRRRMKPRSSSAVIRRWMPDLERRSSASFISSKEGGTPASFNRSWMKRSSSYCLRVSMSSALPRYSPAHCDQRATKTNHEQTLSVPYVFRNHLIWSEQSEPRSKLKIEDGAGGGGFCRRGKGLANDEAIGTGERRQQGAVLLEERGCHHAAVRPGRERCPHVISAFVIAGERAAERSALDG